MVTEVAEEVAPICKKHGVEKVRVGSSAHKKGWYWHCRKCSNETVRRIRLERTNNGLCKYCGINSVVPGRKHCSFCIKAQVIRSRETAVELAEGVRVTKGQKYRWRNAFGLEPEEVYALWLTQDKRCLFGGEPLAWDDAVIDHEHGYPGCKRRSTGVDYGCPKEAVRGLACHKHNQRQGMYEADPEGYMAVARWHVENNGGKWTELCGCQEATNAA